jgi:metal transporter CNNM
MSPSPRDADADEELSNAEMEVISGVLQLAQLRVRDVLIPLNKVDMLSSSQIINREIIEIIDQIGHSRLPVFRSDDEKDIIGFFLVKKLMSVNPDESTLLSKFPLIQPIVIGTNQLLMDVMTIFKNGHTHLAIVSKNPKSLRKTIEEG